MHSRRYLLTFAIFCATPDEPGGRASGRGRAQTFSRIVTMHHLVALGGSVPQGCLNLRDSAGIQWTVFRGVASPVQCLHYDHPRGKATCKRYLSFREGFVSFARRWESSRRDGRVWEEGVTGIKKISRALKPRQKWSPDTDYILQSFESVNESLSSLSFLCEFIFISRARVDYSSR